MQFAVGDEVLHDIEHPFQRWMGPFRVRAHMEPSSIASTSPRRVFPRKTSSACVPTSAVPTASAVTRVS